MDSHVLSVGQCTADDARLARMLSVEANAHVARASTAEEARRLMANRRFDLVLVNRIFDADGQSGVEFIREMKAGGDSACMMLVSDYPEAQAEAVAAGAVRGFGKRDLHSAEVGQLLRQTLKSCTHAGVLKQG